MSNNCPLCHSGKVKEFFEDKRRSYFECLVCSLIHVPEEFHLTVEAEKAEYDLHQNNPDDFGYRQFLSKATKPLVGFLPANAYGIDFGCGSGPTLSSMLMEQGFQMDDFDPIYFPNLNLFSQGVVYDFVVSTEVVEHLRQPAETLKKIWSLLKPDGYLAIMTKQALSVMEFSNWHYKNDPAHICFWRSETFHWLANAFSARIVFKSNDVMILQKL